MRPLRFLLVLALFVVVPVIITCISLFRSDKQTPDAWNAGYGTRSSRFRFLLSFSTPSALFPPSAIISLTDDNSTSFLAAPAQFGPSLPSRGLNGELWVGKGFGDEALLSERDLRMSGFEFGCSDVPGWDIEYQGRPENIQGEAKSTRAAEEAVGKPDIPPRRNPTKRDTSSAEEPAENDVEDGTDDHLHYPLPDSNPASPEKLGEPASVNSQDKTKSPTHADIESLQESADIAGKIVMLSRGGCGFLEKVKWAQRRGGVAVIVGDNEPRHPLTVMYAKGDTSNVTIPAIFTSYYSARMLSTLVPSENEIQLTKEAKAAHAKDEKSKPKGRKNEDKENSHLKKPGSAQAKKASGAESSKDDSGWVQNVLSAVGLDEDENTIHEDSRRPPGSGNIDWVLLEDWDEDKPATASLATQTKKTLKAIPTTSKSPKLPTLSTKKTGDDDFIIGVQDWRDTELIAPKPTTVDGTKKQKGKVESTASQTSTSSSVNPTATALKGGSITPGSGEYDHQKMDAEMKSKQRKPYKSHTSDKHVDDDEDQSLTGKIAAFFHGGNVKITIRPPLDGKASSGQNQPRKGFPSKPIHESEQHTGLWVTLTPTSPSTSPFFDTLLVLVVSPLVTLTFVYGLLLLRSRIRRRRWRAPKSIVERLPVRTYHTMTATSSTTSSSLSSPTASSQSSPALRPASQSRVRPRSQTTTGVLSSSPPVEKPNVKPSPKRKRYTGRQVECVVCLEEYVDGESRVMSLPCGHEFHVDCITPWLVTRRRTCPICKGDVVRSFNRASGDVASPGEDAREEDEETSDDVQDRAAMTENAESSAAIPIPVSEEGITGDDVERGSTVDTPLLGSTPRVQPGRWRGLLGGSISRLSGDTVWRSSSVNDRSR